MIDTELIKVARWVNGYYHRELTEDEIIAIKRELADITYPEFKEHIEFSLLKKVDYFTVQALHKIIEDFREMRNWLKESNLNSFNDLYEN